MTSKVQSRRRFLALMAPAAAGLLATVVAPGAAARRLACPDAEAKSSQGLRRSMNYQPVARDTSRPCHSCTFYAAEGEEGCGRCQILSGIVNRDGSCDAWSS